MADYNWLDTNDDDDDEDSSSGSGRSNDALREARTAAKRNAKALKQANEELAALKAKVHEFTVSQAIAEKGLNPKIARLAKDVPVDELDAFLNDYADVFGAAPQDDGQGTGETGTGVPVAQETLSPDFAAWQRISQGQAQAASPNVGNADIAARIASANSPEELNMLLFGNVNGPAVY